MTKTQKKLWAGLVIMALLSPVGILLPEWLNAGDAWGEWGSKTLEKVLGYLPEGMKQYADFWKAPVPDYQLGGDNASKTVRIVSYIFSGLFGIVVVALVIYGISRVIVKNEK